VWNMANPGPPLDVAQLVRDHHEVLYRYAYRLCGSAADAEDLTQQVFLTAQQKCGQVRDRGCVRAWLFTILRNCYAKSFRGRLPLSLADLDLNELPEDEVEQSIDSERLQAAINSLCEEFKLVVMLFYFEQRPYREIAEVLGIPIGTVMSRLARAKSQLRQALVEPPPPASGVSIPHDNPPVFARHAATR
jgi:RNA polymerase sigma-70 factor (ECF subfamily)